MNAIKRFEKNFQDLVPAIKPTRYLVPLVHVQNHKDNCTYRYSSAYTPNAGHFHGETAEHTWAELNQIGTQTCQMNNGHRQDTLIDHSSDLNFKKLANMGELHLGNVAHYPYIFSQGLHSSVILDVQNNYLFRSEMRSRACQTYMLIKSLSGIC